jgi:hypothetical protein
VIDRRPYQIGLGSFNVLDAVGPVGNSVGVLLAVEAHLVDGFFQKPVEARGHEQIEAGDRGQPQ